MKLHRGTMLLIYGLVVAAPQASADEIVQVVTPLRPPYVVDAGSGFADGPAIRLVQRLAEAAGIDPAIQVVPFERAVMTLVRGDTLYPALLRTPSREAKFQWIGEVFADAAVLFTRRGTEPAADLADAGRFATITVMRGSELVGLLHQAGLANFRTANSEIDNARLLAKGRVDAWFAPAAVGRATWDSLAFDPAALHASRPAEPLSFWVAGSRNLSADTVSRLRRAYDDLKTQGEYDRIVAPLRQHEPPS
jgi:polar amino acid transport system substrate-binding protein